MKTRKGKTTICLTTGQTFKSARETATMLNLSYASVTACLEGRQIQHKGYRFCYIEESSNATKTAERLRKMEQESLHQQFAVAEKHVKATYKAYEKALKQRDEIMAKMSH